MCENRESSRSPAVDGAAGRKGKADGRNPVTHDREQSDAGVVPANRQNKATRVAADGGEGRPATKGNPSQQNMRRTQCRESVPSALERVRQVAIGDKKAKFTALLHHVTVDRLRAAYHRTNPKAAPGLDQVTWERYGEALEVNLKDLHDRIHQGAYRAKPSRRVYIPKTDGRLRPLAIASLEDKIVQGAVVEVMNAIYEEDFLGFSYGFRPGRGQHHALDALATAIVKRKVNWVLDADIRGFFDVIDHERMLEFVQHRIADQRVLRLLRKWLSAGVMEDGKRVRGEVGTPQGATVSPLMANVYLHYVLDLWVHQWRRRHASGEVIIVRFADDFVVGFQHHSDAERFLGELQTRLQKFSLELHQDKTRLIEFGRYAHERRKARGLGKPESFTFLGFTHLCAKTRAGEFMLKRRSDAKRMRAKLKAVKAELRRRMHLPIIEQGVWLRAVVKGYFNYHGVPTNIQSLDRFRTGVARLWLKTLRRRSQRDRMSWERMTRIAHRWLPKPHICHPWPEERFVVTTRGRSPVR